MEKSGVVSRGSATECVRCLGSTSEKNKSRLKSGESNGRQRTRSRSQARDIWDLRRDQIAFYVCNILLLVIVGTHAYILTHPESYPDGARTSTLAAVALSSFALLGYITKTSSLSRAVAAAIGKSFITILSRRAKE